MLRLEAIPAYLVLGTAFYLVGQHVAQAFATLLQTWQSLGF